MEYPKKIMNRKELMGMGFTKAYAALLGVSEKTVRNKINEETDFSFPEAKKTKTELLPEYDIAYLFKSDKKIGKE